MDSSDKSLIEAHLRGDRNAFNGIVRRYGNGILGYLMKMCNNKDMAEDLFQETFKSVHEKIHTVRGNTLKPWIYRIATNLAVSQRRRQKLRKMESLNKQIDCDENNRQPAGPAVPEKQKHPFEEAVNTELKQQVRTALQRLPDRQRNALILVYFQHLSYREVAQTMDCSLGTVKTHIFRALKKLANELPEARESIE